MISKPKESPGDYSRYLRRQAERYAEAKGYDARKLRYARRRGGLTLFPIEGEKVAVAIDGDGNASLMSFLGLLPKNKPTPQ